MLKTRLSNRYVTLGLSLKSSLMLNQYLISPSLESLNQTKRLSSDDCYIFDFEKSIYVPAIPKCYRSKKENRLKLYFWRLTPRFQQPAKSNISNVSLCMLEFRKFCMFFFYTFYISCQ